MRVRQEHDFPMDDPVDNKLIMSRYSTIMGILFYS